MSSSSLWALDKNHIGSKVVEFRNSWLFSPIVWGVLSDKYIPKLIQTPYGYKKSIIHESELFTPLNDKINDCKIVSDRICWELSNQQIFFTKDKKTIIKSIKEFIDNNSEYDISSEGNYPLKQDNIISRFNELADEILKLDEVETPFFVFKNSSCDDGVEYWFSKYDEEDEYVERSLKDLDEIVTEFVYIENGLIAGFKNNVEYFK